MIDDMETNILQLNQLLKIRTIVGVVIFLENAF